MSKIIDCFLYRDEADLLELRTRYLNEAVDNFVIVSGSHSFQGQELKDPLKQLPKNLEPYADKIHSHRVQLPVDKEVDSWALERHQRNASIEAISQLNPNHDDLIILSDVDEIWFSSVAPALKQVFRTEESPAEAKCLLPMWDSYFFADVVQDSPWRRVFCMPWSRFKNSDPFTERTTEANEVLGGPCGWHITYSGGVSGIKRKQSTFAHTEFQNTKFVDETWLAHCIETLSDPYEREINWRQMTRAEMERSMEPALMTLLFSEYPQLLSEDIINENNALSLTSKVNQ